PRAKPPRIKRATPPPTPNGPGSLTDRPPAGEKRCRGRGGNVPRGQGKKPTQFGAHSPPLDASTPCPSTTSPLYTSALPIPYPFPYPLLPFPCPLFPSPGPPHAHPHHHVRRPPQCPRRAHHPLHRR